jgi:hypothetical protein
VDELLDVSTALVKYLQIRLAKEETNRLKTEE